VVAGKAWWRRRWSGNRGEGWRKFVVREREKSIRTDRRAIRGDSAEGGTIKSIRVEEFKSLRV
jgi:hypothetical protein